MTRKTKTPALSTQLKNAQAEVADLKKKLEQSERMQKHYSDKHSEALTEINNVHTLLDAMPNAPARVAKTETSWGSTNETPVPAAIRVSVLLATR